MESMGRHLDDVLLRPGDSVSFLDRDDLLAKLDDLDQRVPGRQEGRTKDHREHFCMLRYLRFLAGADLLPLPVMLRKSAEGTDPPDFVLEWPDGATESFELTHCPGHCPGQPARPHRVLGRIPACGGV